jgi:5-hydroxyisourate hydrolase
MAKITTHVLDTARGKPASGVGITLEAVEGGALRVIARGATDDDGRLRTLTDPAGVPAGTYRLAFETGAYFERVGQESFFPVAHITFVVGDASAHFHVPLLLSPYSFSTYRGS